MRYDLCTPRPKKDGGVFWHRCGTGFDGDKGITLLFDSLPLPDKDGRCVVKLFEQRDNGGQRSQAQQRGGNNSFATDDLDDDIAF